MRATPRPTFPTLPEFDRIFDTLTPFALPFLLLLEVFAVRWTVRRGDVAQDRNLLARHYLYLDAAYGLFPQAIAALYPTLADSLRYPQLLTAWQAVITFRLLPSDLYAKGESFDQPMQLFKQEPQSQVPWKRYLTMVFITLPVLGYGLVLILFLVAFGVSEIAHLWFAQPRIP